MIRPLLIIVCILCFGALSLAEEQNLTNNSTNMSIVNASSISSEQNLNLTTNVTNSSVSNGGDGTGSLNTSSLVQNSELNQSKSTVNEPVYKESIGSVYSPDYTEPQPMTFSYSGCGQF